MPHRAALITTLCGNKLLHQVQSMSHLHDSSATSRESVLEDIPSEKTPIGLGAILIPNFIFFVRVFFLDKKIRDRMKQLGTRLGEWVIQHRWMVIILTIAIVLIAGSGIQAPDL